MTQDTLSLLQQPATRSLGFLSHITPCVHQCLAELQRIPVFLPPKTAPDLSLCDNFFFHLFKNKFKTLNRSTPDKKKAVAEKAYSAVSEHSVLACFKKCKLLIEETNEKNDEEVSSKSEIEDEFLFML